MRGCSSIEVFVDFSYSIVPFLVQNHQRRRLSLTKLLLHKQSCEKNEKKHIEGIPAERLRERNSVGDVSGSDGKSKCQPFVVPSGSTGISLPSLGHVVVSSLKISCLLLVAHAHTSTWQGGNRGLCLVQARISHRPVMSVVAQQRDSGRRAGLLDGSWPGSRKCQRRVGLHARGFVRV